MHDFGGRDAPRSDVRKPGTREGGCFRCSRGAGKSISQFGRQEEEGFPLTVFLSPSGLQRVGRGPPHPPPPGREAMCSARSTDSHVSRIREPSQKHPGQCVAQHLGISWPSQDHSTITHYRGPGGSAAPGAQPGERRRRARGSSDSAAPKHRRRVGSRESRVSAAGLLAPSGAASERRSGSLCCSQRQVRCRSAPE